jgi:hypothetical protein
MTAADLHDGVAAVSVAHAVEELLIRVDLDDVHFERSSLVTSIYVSVRRYDPPGSNDSQSLERILAEHHKIIDSFEKLLEFEHAGHPVDGHAVLQENGARQIPDVEQFGDRFVFVIVDVEHGYLNVSAFGEPGFHVIASWARRRRERHDSVLFETHSGEELAIRVNLDETHLFFTLCLC